MHLVPNPPLEGFKKSPNIKLYVGWLQKPLIDILDMEKFQQLPVNIAYDKIPKTRHITIVRHQHSRYNEYSDLIQKTPEFAEFMASQNIARKHELADIFLEDFIRTIGIDYDTQLSTKWHQDWETLGKNYAQLIKQSPELFPDLIYVSPYVRTRRTTYHQFRHIEGLDMDIEKLINEEELEDLIIWSFEGKDIAIKIDERIREREHGSNMVPGFIRKFLIWEKKVFRLLDKMQKEKIYYFTSPDGGESQAQTNARSESFLNRIQEKKKFENIYIESHHLTEIWALLSIFGWSFQTFYKLNELWKPANGSFTVLSQIPKTQKWEENKFRVSAYNLSLEA